MRNGWVLLAGGIVAMMLAAEPSHAQLFGRRWERRKAELYGEISAEVRRDMGYLGQSLRDSTSAHIDGEVGRLEKAVEKEVAELRRQAAEIVATESKKLQAQTAEHVNTLKQTAQTAVNEEAKKLGVQVQDSVKSLRDQVAGDTKKLQEMLLADAVKQRDATNSELKQALTKFQAQSTEELNKQKSVVADLSKKAGDDLRAMISGELAKVEKSLSSVIDSKVKEAKEEATKEAKASLAGELKAMGEKLEKLTKVEAAPAEVKPAPPKEEEKKPEAEPKKKRRKKNNTDETEESTSASDQ